MERMRALFMAGGLTGLVLVTMLVLGLRAQSAPETLTTETPVPVEALVEQNQQLRDAVQTMQEREAQYQAQIEAANQTIRELQDQSAPAYYEDDEDEHEDEHEEHEHEEHDDD